LADEGARIAIVGTNADKLRRAHEQLAARGATVYSAVLDVTDEAAWAPVVQAIETRMGPVQALFLNAGIGTGGTTVESAPAALWRWTFDVNLMGVVHGLRAVLPGLKSRNQPSHIIISSSIAAVTQPAGLGPYTVSKAAVLALAETLRTELNGSEIKVSVVIPAAVRTDFSATSQSHAPTDWGTVDSSKVFAQIRDFLDGGLDPLAVGRFVLGRMRESAFYIFTHPDFRQSIAAQQTELLASIPLKALTPPGSGA
jgi:NADP-dependent 3-hydroxy acid dehydrogenase YdfG